MAWREPCATSRKGSALHRAMPSRRGSRWSGDSTCRLRPAVTPSGVDRMSDITRFEACFGMHSTDGSATRTECLVHPACLRPGSFPFDATTIVHGGPSGEWVTRTPSRGPSHDMTCDRTVRDRRLWRRSLPVEAAPIQGRLRVTWTPRSHDQGRACRGRERLAAASRRAAARAEHHATSGGVDRTRATDERCRHRDRTRRNPRREQPTMRPWGALAGLWHRRITRRRVPTASSSASSPLWDGWRRGRSTRRLATRFDRISPAG